MRKTLPSIGLFLFAFTISAQASIYVDDTYTTDKKHFYTEFSYDYYKNAEDFYDLETGEYLENISKEQYASIYFSYGILDNWDAGFTIPYVFIDGNSMNTTNGFNDIVIETKYRLWDEGRLMPSFALYFDVKLPSANQDRGLGSGEYDFTISSIFTKNIGKETFDFNLGYVFIQESGVRDIMYYAFDITHSLTEKLYLCAEIYGDTNFQGRFNDNTLCSGISLGYNFSALVNLEIGAGVGISKASPDYQLSSTLSFTF